MNPITNLNFSTMMNNKNTTGVFPVAEDVLETMSPAYDQMNDLVADAYLELSQINLTLEFEQRRVNECSTPSERFEVAEAVVFWKVRRDQCEAKCKSLETIRLDLYMAMDGLRRVNTFA